MKKEEMGSGEQELSSETIERWKNVENLGFFDRRKALKEISAWEKAHPIDGAYEKAWEENLERDQKTWEEELKVLDEKMEEARKEGDEEKLTNLALEPHERILEELNKIQSLADGEEVQINYALLQYYGMNVGKDGPITREEAKKYVEPKALKLGDYRASSFYDFRLLRKINENKYPLEFFEKLTPQERDMLDIDWWGKSDEELEREVQHMEEEHEKYLEAKARGENYTVAESRGGTGQGYGATEAVKYLWKDKERAFPEQRRIIREKMGWSGPSDREERNMIKWVRKSKEDFKEECDGDNPTIKKVYVEGWPYIADGKGNPRMESGLTEMMERAKVLGTVSALHELEKLRKEQEARETTARAKERAF